MPGWIFLGCCISWRRQEPYSIPPGLMKWVSALAEGSGERCPGPVTPNVLECCADDGCSPCHRSGTIPSTGDPCPRAVQREYLPESFCRRTAQEASNGSKHSSRYSLCRT